MVSLASLWLPIVLSAVFVFIASSVVHMVLKYHNNDYRKLPAQDEVMDALQRFQLPPGDYIVPRAVDRKEMASPEFLDKMKRGPVMILTVLPSGPFTMGSSLALWFVFTLVVSLFAAYVAAVAVGPDGDYLTVFRLAGATAFAGYALAAWQTSIWYKRAWTTNLKLSIDGLIYAFLTGGTLGWLWPQ